MANSAAAAASPASAGRPTFLVVLRQSIPCRAPGVTAGCDDETLFLEHMLS